MFMKVVETSDNGRVLCSWTEKKAGEPIADAGIATFSSVMLELEQSQRRRRLRGRR